MKEINILKIKNEFEKKGVVIIKNFFKKNEVLNLEKKIKQYLKKNKDKLKSNEINYIKNKVNSVHKFKNLYFKKFCNNKKIKEIGDQLLGVKSRFQDCEYFAKPAKIGLDSPMHQDNYYWNLKNPKAITMWIAIDPANKKNGSLEYLLESHKGGLVKHIPSFAPGSSQRVKNLKKYKKKYKKKSFNLKKGDCLIHHCLIIHGSKKNLSNISRRGFTIQLTNKNNSINKKQFALYKKSLEQQKRVNLV